MFVEIALLVYRETRSLDTGKIKGLTPLESILSRGSSNGGLSDS